MCAQRTTADNCAAAALLDCEQTRRGILVVEPDAERRRQVALGLRALGYAPDVVGSVSQVPWSSAGPWSVVLTGTALPVGELADLQSQLDRLGENRPSVRSLAPLYGEDGTGGDPGTGAETEPPAASTAGEPWSDEFRIKLLRWVADTGSAALRPEPCPGAPLGHAYHHLESHFGFRSGESMRLLEDLADFGVLKRRLANRIYVCPQCRRWTVAFRETCPACSSLDVDVEGMIHHFACAYVGLDGEFRRGMDLECPKCRKRLNHIGLDYERPRQTYVCHTCDQIFEEPVVSAQCLDCRWAGGGGDVLPSPIYEYELSARGQEAVERGELRGLKLREMIRTARYELASCEFLELEVEREMFRLQRYRRPMSMLLCGFRADGVPYALFRETDQQTLQAFARTITHEVRKLDVAAQIDASTIAILLPEIDESGAEKALARLRKRVDGFGLTTRAGREVDRHWTKRTWILQSAQADDALLWLQQRPKSQEEEA